MIVAEQPTSGDDAYGRMFVGRGLLEIKKWLKDEGIDAHFTYAIKCAKPDKDTKPKPKHIKICRTAYLQHEIEAVKPKHIIVLGSQAITAVLGKARKMSEVQGTRFEDPKSGAWIYATLHSAQALYSEENKQAMWTDLKIFAKWIKGGYKELTKFDPPVMVADTLRSLKIMARKIAQSGGKVAVDTETDGLNPYHPDRNIRTIQFCWDPKVGGVFVPLMVGDGCYYTDKKALAIYWDEEDLAKAVKIIRKILFNSRIIWHNGKFDRIWLWMWGKRNFGSPIRCPNIYMDTMHVAYLLNENRALKLKRLITTEFGFPSYDISDKLTKDMDIMIPYATRDTVACFMLSDKYGEKLQEEGMEKMRKFYFNVMRRADALYTKMEIRGWPVHEVTAKSVKADLDRRLIEIEDEMHDVLAKYDIEVDAKVFASPAKLSPLIWEQLGLTPSSDPNIAYTDGKTKERLSTGENALIHVIGHPFVSKLLEWRSLAKALQTYATPMLHAAQNRGKITTSYRLAKVVTGRTASGKEEGSGASAKTAEGMNLQNLPPTFGIKDIIQCPDSEDEWIMECDFSQIELRIAGELSQDRTLLWAYANNVDLHTYRAMRVLSLDEEGWDQLDKAEKKKARNNAKPVNFGYLYGMSWMKFRQFALVQYKTVFSSDEAKENRALFFRDHAGLEKWYGKQERMAYRLGYVETLSGRRRHLPDIFLDQESSKEAKGKYKEAVRQAINSPVQGFGSDLKMMAAIEIDMVIDPSEAKLFGEIHDSILLRVKKHAIHRVAAQILPIMRHPKLLDTLGITLKVPIDAEVEVGPSLGQKKEIKEWKELERYAA